jgi:hypothetical protein
MSNILSNADSSFEFLKVYMDYYVNLLILNSQIDEKKVSKHKIASFDHFIKLKSQTFEHGTYVTSMFNRYKKDNFIEVKVK